MAAKQSETVTEWVATTPAAPSDEVRDPGPGEVVVTSPTGSTAVVPEAAVAALQTQGYTVG